MQEMPFQRSKIQNISGVQYHRTPLKMSSLLPKVTKLLDLPLIQYVNTVFELEIFLRFCPL